MDFIEHIVAVDVEWKLSMAISTNDVRNLNEPLVTMMLVTTDESGNKVKRPVEMTLAKFREFYGTIKQIQSQMESAKLL